MNYNIELKYNKVIFLKKNINYNYKIGNLVKNI